MAMRRGISEIIGFLILLIILLVALIPLGFLLLSQPTAQVQSATTANSYKNLAVQQFTDFQPVYFSSSGFAVAPVYFIYDNGYAYFVLPTNQNPPVNLVIKAIEVFNGSTWVTQPVNVEVTLANANAKFYGYPAIKIALKVLPYKGQASYVAAVTQYGNIIYASLPYVLPLPKLVKPVGIVSLDPYNFSIVEEPQWSSIVLSNSSVPLMEFIRLINGNYSNALTFLGECLTGKNGLPFYFEGYWFGPIMYTTSSSGISGILTPQVPSSPPWFRGEIRGVFVGANFTFVSGSNGYFSGFLGSSNGNPIWFDQGTAQSATFENAELLGTISANSFTGWIVIPGQLLNDYSFLGTSQGPTVTLKGNQGYYNFSNVSGTIDFNGKFTGYVNGQKVSISGNGQTISGTINNGTLVGEIVSANLGPAVLTVSYYGIPENEYVNGYIYVNAPGLELDFGGSQVGFLNLLIAPIVSGYMSGVIFNKVYATSVPASSYLFSFELFNITLNNYVGTFTLSNNHVDGTLVGKLIFPTPSESYILFGYPITAASYFDGYINGTFSGNYNYTLSYYFSDTVTVSVIKSNASVTPTYSVSSISSSGSVTYEYYYDYISPLVFKVQIAVANPSNTTLEFTEVQATMKAEAVLQFASPSSASTPYTATLYGSADDHLEPYITVKPLSVSNFTLYLTIPVNTIVLEAQLTPTSYKQIYQNLESFQVNYIELYLNFLEPNGYGVAVSTIIPPYYVPTTGIVIS